MAQTRLPVMFAALVLLLASLACGSSNQGEKVTTVEDVTSAPKATSAPAKYKIGDVVRVENHTIVLNSVQSNGDMLITNLSIENQGQKELSVSSLASFEAKDGEGTKLDQAMFDCPSGSFGGTVLAGDKLKGNICWKAPAGTQGVRLYYRANLFASDAVVWELDAVAQAAAASGEPEKTAEKPSSTQGNSIQSHTMGEVIKIEDHTIVLNSAKLDGDRLVVNFTVENPSSKEVTVSSVMSFEAKDSEGTKLEQDMFDCPSGGLDGTVLPGDKLKGNICWKADPASKGIRVYYSANLFGGQTVVWDAQ